MQALQTPPAAIPAAPAPRRTLATMHRYRHPTWVRHTARPSAFLVVAALLVTLSAMTYRPAVTLLAAGAIDLGQGIFVTPAPGWTVGGQGPGWVTLHNTFATAEMEIKIKPAEGTDAAATLQADIDQLSNVSTTGLTNVRDLTIPTSKPLQSKNFEQEAAIDYSADGTSAMGPIPVVGTFVELLNTSTHRSAFIVFAQNGDSTVRADDQGTMMVDSML